MWASPESSSLSPGTRREDNLGQKLQKVKGHRLHRVCRVFLCAAGDRTDRPEAFRSPHHCSGLSGNHHRSFRDRLETMMQRSGLIRLLLHECLQAEKNRAAAAANNLQKGSSGPMRLYVGSLHFNITEEMLRGIFEPFGKVRVESRL